MKRKLSLYRFISQVLRLPLSGPVFRLYAPRLEHIALSSTRPGLKILIVNLMSSLGDTICYMPMVEVLRAEHPDAEITWLANSTLANLIAKLPDVDRVLTIKIPQSLLLRIPTVMTYYRLWSIMRAIKSLKIQEGFDIAIVPRGGVDPLFSAHAVWMLNLPYSVGYSYRIEQSEIDHHFGDSLLSQAIKKVRHIHEAERAVDLLEVAGLVQDPHKKWNSRMPIRALHSIAQLVDIYELYKRCGIASDSSFVVMSPGTGQPRKTWPAENFHQLCKLILENTDQHIVITGTDAETILANTIKNGLGNRVISCAGKLNLIELIGIISRASLFIGNDSGAGHIAGPLCIPTISLHVQPKKSDPNHIHAPEHYRPIGPNVTIIQPDDFLAPCHGRCESKIVHCLKQITVDEVWAAVVLSLHEITTKTR